jgi:hypothetical protein
VPLAKKQQDDQNPKQDKEAYAHKRPKLGTKESIIADIAGQNFASKRCVIAHISGNIVRYKYHPFHR